MLDLQIGADANCLANLHAHRLRGVATTAGLPLRQCLRCRTLTPSLLRAPAARRHEAWSLALSRAREGRGVSQPALALRAARGLDVLRGVDTYCVLWRDGSPVDCVIDASRALTGSMYSANTFPGCVPFQTVSRNPNPLEGLNLIAPMRCHAYLHVCSASCSGCVALQHVAVCWQGISYKLRRVLHARIRTERLQILLRVAFTWGGVLPGNLSIALNDIRQKMRSQAHCLGPRARCTHLICDLTFAHASACLLLTPYT
eukprot:358942-Chlamydomonas_euryale.AAC.1